MMGHDWQDDNQVWFYFYIDRTVSLRYSDVVKLEVWAATGSVRNVVTEN